MDSWYKRHDKVKNIIIHILMKKKIWWIFILVQEVDISNGSTEDMSIIEINKELLADSVYEERKFNGKIIHLIMIIQFIVVLVMI